MFIVFLFPLFADVLRVASDETLEDEDICDHSMGAFSSHLLSMRDNSVADQYSILRYPTWANFSHSIDAPSPVRFVHFLWSNVEVVHVVSTAGPYSATRAPSMSLL